MYSYSKFIIKKDNLLSSISKYEKGVRQGLRTLLFNVYINGINKIFDASIAVPFALNSTRLNCFVYADDLVSLSESKCLQSCLDSLQMHFVSLTLKYVDKTKV